MPLERLCGRQWRGTQSATKTYRQTLTHIMKFALYILILFVFFSCADRKKENSDANNLSDSILLKGKQESDSTVENKSKVRAIHSDVLTECYINDTLKWCGFMFDYQFLFPKKGHNLFVDSAYVTIPFENGKMWYEGKFVCYGTIHKKHIGKGIHKIWNIDGSIKGIVDYSKREITKFDNTGKSENYSFNQYKKIEPHMVKWSEIDSLAFGR